MAEIRAARVNHLWNTGSINRQFLPDGAGIAAGNPVLAAEYAALRNPDFVADSSS
jgi:hypothetical protein